GATQTHTGRGRSGQRDTAAVVRAEPRGGRRGDRRRRCSALQGRRVRGGGAQGQHPHHGGTGGPAADGDHGDAARPGVGGRGEVDVTGRQAVGQRREQ